jgi:hypothetical protein
MTEIAVTDVAAPPVWTLVIEGRLLSPNQLLRRHWSVVSRNANVWKDAVGWSAKQAGVPHLGRARLEITRYGSRTLDYDGLVGSCKVVCDSLVAAEIIDDDSPAHVTVTYRQAACARGRERVEVRIWAWEMEA